MAAGEARPHAQREGREATREKTRGARGTTANTAHVAKSKIAMFLLNCLTPR